MVPREVCAASVEKNVTTAESGAERTEVSRGHSNREMKGRIDRSLKYDPERRNEH